MGAGKQAGRQAGRQAVRTCGEDPHPRHHPVAWARDVDTRAGDEVWPVWPLLDDGFYCLHESLTLLSLLKVKREDDLRGEVCGVWSREKNEV
jgi:hypothetical protein